MMDFKYFCKEISSLATEIAEYYYDKVLSGEKYNDQYTSDLTIIDIEEYNKLIDNNSEYIHQFLFDRGIKYELFYRNNCSRYLISNDISQLKREEFDHIYTNHIVVYSKNSTLITNDFKDGKRIVYKDKVLKDYPHKISNGKIFNESEYLEKFSTKITELMKLLITIKDKLFINCIKDGMEHNDIKNNKYMYMKLLMDVTMEILIKCKK